MNFKIHASSRTEYGQNFSIELYRLFCELHNRHDSIDLPNNVFLFLRLQPYLTRRQLAEIQLAGIMDDPELSSFHLVNNETKFELEGLAARLHSQPWLIKRILRTLGAADTDSVGARDIHILTRVLTGSFDARLLLFFNVIDIDYDKTVSTEELMLFFSKYLDGLASFQTSEVEGEVRRKTILTSLLDKFQLHQDSQIDFDQFHELVLKDQLLIEALSRFTVHPSW
jgi:Ca2+-binding EF-hand superfamily protein